MMIGADVEVPPWDTGGTCDRPHFFLDLAYWAAPANGIVGNHRLTATHGRKFPNGTSLNNSEKWERINWCPNACKWMTTEFLGGLFGYLILKLVLMNRESRILIPSRLELLLFLFVVSARRSMSWELMRNSDSRSWANELHSPSEAISRVLRYAIKASYVATGDRWVFVSTSPTHTRSTLHRGKKSPITRVFL